MRYILYVSLVLFSGILQKGFSQEKPFCKHPHHLARYEKQAAKNKANPQTKSFTANYDLKYHRFEWNINPHQRFISGTVTSYFTPSSADFQKINFDFSSSLQVNEIRYHGQSLNHTIIP